MDRLTAILSYSDNLTDEDKLAILSIMELAGASFIELGNIVELDDAPKLETALNELEEIQTRCSYIIDRHPMIMALTGG